MAADATAGKALAGVAALGVVEDSLAEALDGIGTGRVLSRAQLSMLRKCLPALRRTRVAVDRGVGALAGTYAKRVFKAEMTDLTRAGEHVLGQQGDEKHLARRIKAIPTSLKNNKPVAGESPARVGPRKRRQPERGADAARRRGNGGAAAPGVRERLPRPAPGTRYLSPEAAVACVMGAGPKRSPARTRARRLLLARKLVPVGDGQLVRRVTAAEKAGFTPSGPVGADAAGGKRAAWARW